MSWLFLTDSLLHHQNFCFQFLLLVPATIVFNISYSQSILTLSLPSLMFFLSLVKFLCASQDLFQQSEGNHGHFSALVVLAWWTPLYC